VYNHFTRHNNFIRCDFNRLNISNTSFNSVGISLFNKLHHSAHTVSSKCFKKKLHKWLVRNPFL
ncbi:hypothetical protein C0J52_24620, partial [Blattella germanica]